MLYLLTATLCQPISSNANQRCFVSDEDGLLMKQTAVLGLLLLLLSACLPGAVNEDEHIPTLLVNTQPVNSSPTASGTGIPAADPPALAMNSARLEGVSFDFSASLAVSATGQLIPAYFEPSGNEFANYPGHMRFDFVNPYTFNPLFNRFPAGSAPWYGHQINYPQELRPQVFIFPVDDFARMSEDASSRITALQTIRDVGSYQPGDELPVLPVFNSAQDVRAQIKALSFENGGGIRFIARYSQEATPVINPQLFYTYQGLTEDGDFYIAAFFPVYTSALPDEIDVSDWDAFNLNYRDYLGQTIQALDDQPGSSYMPDLALLDELVRSIIVDGIGTESTGTVP
jgi:hypothetical protein